MKFYRCDVCGKRFSPEEIRKYKRSAKARGEAYYTLDKHTYNEKGSMQNEVLDLCPDCLEKLNRWRLGYERH